MSAEVDVFLDVDGVLNALGREPEWGWESPARTETVNGWPIRWSPDLVDRLNALAALPNVHFHWLTTWLHDSAMICEALGLNGLDWPVLGAEFHASRTNRWWKLPAARAQAEATDRRIVWIDDDLYDSEAREWARLLGARIMLVQPSTHDGITADLMGAIESWIDGELAAAS